jgi:uncharacterized protein YjbJ (UPF0337 family)
MPSLGIGKRWIPRSTLPNAFRFQYQEQTMNKDQTKGRIEEVKGKVKEIAGKVVGDEDLEVKGKAQNIGGKAQATYGDMKADLKKAVQSK